MSSTTEKIWWKIRKLKDEYFTIAEIIQILWIWKKKWKSYIFCVNFRISAFLKFVKHNKSKNIKEKNKKIHYFIFILGTLKKKKTLLFHIRNGAHENTERGGFTILSLLLVLQIRRISGKKGKNIYITKCYSVKLFESRVESCKIFLFTLEQFRPFKYHK